MNPKELQSFLDFKAQQYESIDFIAHDPIQSPHRFSQKKDIEIAAFLSATIAWGNRVSILKSAQKIMSSWMMPLMISFSIIKNIILKILMVLFIEHLTVRTLNILLGLYKTFIKTTVAWKDFFLYQKSTFKNAFINSKDFFELDHPSRTQKHISDPLKGSAAKRINMFLRWMVRSNKKGVDFGIWKSISTSELSLPLDVHNGNVARKLGLLKRKQNDAKTLLELDTKIRKFDPKDPVKYDFALFGLGAFEKF